MARGDSRRGGTSGLYENISQAMFGYNHELEAAATDFLRQRGFRADGRKLASGTEAVRDVVLQQRFNQRMPRCGFNGRSSKRRAKR